MLGQLVLSSQGSLNLIGKAIAINIQQKYRRVFLTQGVTNQFILKFLGIKDKNHLKGYLSTKGMQNCFENKGAYVLENGVVTFYENDIFKGLEIKETDLVLKSGNTLTLKDGQYSASVLSAAKDLGTYKNVYLRAIASSADVLIPMSFDKFSPYTNTVISHKDIDIFMGDFSVISLPLFYGRVYTEVEAFLDLFSLKASFHAKGISEDSVLKVFLVEGDEKNILEAKDFMLNHN